MKVVCRVLRVGNDERELCTDVPVIGQTMVGRVGDFKVDGHILVLVVALGKQEDLPFDKKKKRRNK